MSESNATAAPPPAEPLLRTLAPALRNLEGDLRRWLERRHRSPLKSLTRSSLEGLALDLRRKADDLDVDRPLLAVMLMGGTGVGKSSLLNALAGAPIAQAAFTRPTTRDPVVYYHESIRPERLDPALRHCRLSAHAREELREKVLVDTPDVDSNDLTNRERLLKILPVADVVLYVGSQEKYHDQLVWRLFKEQRKRQGFAFVLNKWDRCLHQAENAGTRPDEDLLRDLAAEGFAQPLLFRVAAQMWIDARTGGSDAVPTELPPGEQFRDLVDWLTRRLTAREVEAIKARGVGQLLEQLDRALVAAAPPDLAEAAGRVRAAWEKQLAAEAHDFSEVLLGTLDPYQSEIEQHFRAEGQKRFHGLYAGFQRMIHGVKQAGTSLRDRLPFLPRPAEKLSVPVNWNAAAFTAEASRAAHDRSLGRRLNALGQRLLVEADALGFPMGLLEPAAAEAGKLNWPQRLDRGMRDALGEVEQVWARPTGPTRLFQGGFLLAANYLPALAFLTACMLVLWRFFMPAAGYKTELIDLFLPVFILLVVLVLLSAVEYVALPMRWPAIRAEFDRRLERALSQELVSAYADAPAEVAEALAGERQAVERLRTEVRDLAAWLARQEQAARVDELYGS
jgi:energy-coupling factor transporter ATP-binding protein EcfA2